MRTLPAGKFKDVCLRTLDEVRSSRAPVLITKRGRPVARLVPAPEADEVGEPTSRLTPESAQERLADVARSRGMTPDAVLAEMLEACYRPRISREVADRAIAAAGRFSSGVGNLSENHDEEYALSVEEQKGLRT